MSPTLRQNVRATPAAAWALFAGTFVNRFGTFVVPFLMLYLTRNGYSIPQAGLAAGAYGAGSLGASLVGGLLADRMGRRNAIALSMFSSAVTMLLLWRATILVVIVPLAGVGGLAAELYRPASSALIADLLPPERRMTGYALYRLAINAGWAVGPAVAGLMARRSFAYIFVGDALTSVVFGLIALALLPHGVRSAREHERPGEATRSVLRDRPFLLFLGSSLALAFVYIQSLSTFPLQVKASGLSPAVYGALLSVNGLVIVLIELPITSVTQRFPARPVIALGSLLVGLGFGLNVVAHAVPLLATAVVLWTLGEIVGAPVASAFVADLSPERLRGRYQAAWGVTFALGAILGPSLGATIFARSPNALWATCAGLGVLSAVLVLAARPKPQVGGLVEPPSGSAG